MALTKILKDGTETGETVATKVNLGFDATDLNTAKVGITSTQASAITANTAKISYTDATLVASHTTTLSNHSTDISTNTTNISSKVTTDPTGVSGAVKIDNMFKLTQAQYDALTPDAGTFYVIVG